MSTPPSSGSQDGYGRPYPPQSPPSSHPYPPASQGSPGGQGYGGPAAGGPAPQGYGDPSPGTGSPSQGFGAQGDLGQQPPSQQPPSQQPPGYGPAPGGSGPQQGGIFAQDPPKKSGPGKWIAIGCGGCAVLVLIIVLIVGLLWHFGGGFKPDSDVPTPPSSSEATPTDDATVDDDATTDDATTDEATGDDEATTDEATTDDAATGDEVVVTFEVETDGGHSLVTYSAPGGELDQKWFDEKTWNSKETFADASDLIGVNMNVIPGEGEATCRIIIDGEVVDEQTDEDMPMCMVPVDYNG
jgi:hypothetical protein